MPSPMVVIKLGVSFMIGRLVLFGGVFASIDGLSISALFSQFDCIYFATLSVSSSLHSILFNIGSSALIILTLTVLYFSCSLNSNFFIFY